MTILGISVGTTRTAVCVLQDGVLLDREIHNYTAPWSEWKMRIIVNRYKRYVVKRKVSAIVVKIPPLESHSKAVKLLIQRIEKLAKDHGCEFDLITKRELKHRTGAISTDDLIRYALLLHPELATFGKNTHTDHLYSKKLFEAVMSAHTYRKMHRTRRFQPEPTKE